jgi:hypothetical protein
MFMVAVVHTANAIPLEGYARLIRNDRVLARILRVWRKSQCA